MTDQWNPRPLKTYKLEFGGMYIFYSGRNIGEAIAQMIKDRPHYLKDLESVTVEKIYER